MRQALYFLNRYVRWLGALLWGIAFPVFAQYKPPLPGDQGIPLPTTTDVNSIGSFYTIICAATQWVLVFGLLIGVLFIIYGGATYITSAGESSKTEDAKKTILMALVGVVFLILAIAVIRIIAGFFGGDLSKFTLNTATCTK